MLIYRHETPPIPTGAVAARIDLPDHPPQPVNPAFKFQVLREASEVRIDGEVAVVHHHSIFVAAPTRQPRVLKIQTSIPPQTSPAVDTPHLRAVGVSLTEEEVSEICLACQFAVALLFGGYICDHAGSEGVEAVERQLEV